MGVSLENMNFVRKYEFYEKTYCFSTNKGDIDFFY